MQLTTQTTETLVRKMASAPFDELQRCAKELKAMAGDDGQTEAVRMTARRLAAVVRKRAREI